MFTDKTLPVIEFHALQKYIQEVAVQQWSGLNPKARVMLGIVRLPTIPKPEEIIDWFTDKRRLFELHDLPETFIIEYKMCYIIVSQSHPTYAES